MFAHSVGVAFLSSFFSRHAQVRMNIFQIGGGARAALFALAILFASLPFGIEQVAAQSAAVVPFGVTPTEFVDTGSLAVASLTASADPTHPACAIAAAAIGNAALFAIPTLFLLPEAVDLLNRSTGAEFVRLRSSRAKGTS